VPVPYPNTGFASDLTEGSKKVQISGREVLLRNKSYFKKSVGNEAGAAQKKGIMTSVNRGKVYFIMWSMDVKIEGMNAVRHLDMTTHNHGSNTNTPPMIYADRMALMKSVQDCDREKAKIKESCGKDGERALCPDQSGVNSAREAIASTKRRSSARRRARAELNKALEDYALDIRSNKPCQRAMRCALVPYHKEKGCCGAQTPEHLVPASQFGKGRGRNHPNYNASRAACLCAEGGATVATHGLLGGARRRHLRSKGLNPRSGRWTVDESIEGGAKSASEVFPHCSQACLESQLKKNHDDMGVDRNEKIRCVNNEDDKRSFEFYHRFVLGAGS